MLFGCFLTGYLESLGLPFQLQTTNLTVETSILNMISQFYVGFNEESNV